MASGYNRRTVGDSASHQPRGHARGARGRRRGRRRTGGNVNFGFKSFEKLSKAEPDDIVLDLASERCLPAFRTLLAKTDMSDEMIELVVDVLARACDSNSPEYFNKLLIELPRSLFVILSLKGYLTRMCVRRNANPQLFIERTVKLFTEILKKIPSAFDSLPLGDLEQAVDVLAGIDQISPDVVQNVEQLKVIKKESLEKEMRKMEFENQRRTRSRNPGLRPCRFFITLLPKLKTALRCPTLAWEPRCHRSRANSI
jgi:hypothetical protein